MYEQHLYKQQLYNTLSNDQNLVDNVKLQLRQKIISKLKSTKVQNRQVQPQKQFVKKICYSLFLEFLQQKRMFHTLAVFGPESGQGREIMKVEQMRQLLKVVGKKQQQQSTSNLSTLQHIIREYLPRSRLMLKTIQTSCQTDSQHTIQSLQSKLSNIQFQYKQKSLDSLKTVQDSEQRFIKYKNQLNQRYKLELQQQIKRIREFEIVKVRLEEKERAKIKTKQYEEELELSYQNRMEKLRQREAEVMTRVASKMKEVETYNYQARQRMLKDFEAIKLKEDELEKMKEQVLEQQRRNAADK